MSSNCIQILLVLVIHVLCIHCNGHTIVRCPAGERNALLGFKSGIIDHAGRLASWAGSDCCEWRGVRCSNATGSIVRLDLRNPLPMGDTGRLYNRGSLRGNISPSLVGLARLSYLDLSCNFFHRISIPSFFGSFPELRYLNLSRAGFTGLVPPELGNLSSLRSLDLHSYPYEYGQHVLGGLWLSGLSSLRYLDMGGLDLSGSGSWLEALNTLPHITEIHLSMCQLQSIPQSLPVTNFTHLSFLDLSLNGFGYGSTLPGYLFSMTSLRHLDLRDSGFGGLVSDAIGNLTSLEYLDLSAGFTGRMPRALAGLCNLRTLNLEHVVHNDSLLEFGEALSGCTKDGLEALDLSNNGLDDDRLPDWLGELKSLRLLDLSLNSLRGPIPASIGGLSSLETLVLYHNALTGPVSENLGHLSKLVTLDLTYNPLKATLTEGHFANLASLKHLDLYNSSLTLNISTGWLPPFRLETAYTRNVRQGPRFPSWLRNQDEIRYIDMSGAGIADDMPDWFWNITSHVSELYMSDNEIRGRLPGSLSFPSGREPVRIDLSSNLFEGRLPQLPSSVAGLYLSNNSLSGRIPPAFADAMPNLTYLSLSANGFTGAVPASICGMRKLKALDLSKNRLSGEVPDCWDRFPDLQYLNLESNGLSGSFPSSIAAAPSLQLLDLSNNSLSGRLPGSFESRSMNTLDLSRNSFTGEIPSWIAGSERMLRILSLGSNRLTGGIPAQLSSLPSLHILDLSDNELSGEVPPALGSIGGMRTAPDGRGVVYYDDFSWEGLLLRMWVAAKGRYLEYGKLLSLLTFMDLSGNRLSGRIPEELARLRGLQSLNLSGNRLEGGITSRLGELRALETLDLSRNRLSGPVPASLAGLHFLSHLNVSHNRLVGRIPAGGQLQSLVDPSIYAGNDGLCGFPSGVSCDGENTSSHRDGGGGRYWTSGWFWFSVGAGPGFGVGFWTFCGVLILRRGWRDAYFLSVDRMLDFLSSRTHLTLSSKLFNRTGPVREK